MCYLVAKKFDKEGSLVLELEQGQRLASLSIGGFQRSRFASTMKPTKI